MIIGNFFEETFLIKSASWQALLVEDFLEDFRIFLYTSTSSSVGFQFWILIILKEAISTRIGLEILNQYSFTLLKKFPFYVENELRFAK